MKYIQNKKENKRNETKRNETSFNEKPKEEDYNNKKKRTKTYNLLFVSGDAAGVMSVERRKE